MPGGAHRRDLVSGAVGWLSGNASLNGGGPFGPALNNVASSNIGGMTWPYSPQLAKGLIGSSALTIIVLANITSLTTGGWDALLSLPYLTSGWNSPYATIYLSRYSNTSQALVIPSNINGGNWFKSTASGYYQAGVGWAAYAVTWTSAGVATWYRNGVVFESDVFSGVTLATAKSVGDLNGLSMMTAGPGTGVHQDAYGQAAMGAVWNRALSQADVIEVSRAPYQFLSDPRDPVRSVYLISRLPPATLTRDVPASVALLATLTRDVPSSVALQSTLTRNVPASALVGLSTFTRDVPASVALLATLTRDVPSSVALQSTLTRNVPASVALLATLSRLVTSSAQLAYSYTRSVPASVALIVPPLQYQYGTFVLSDGKNYLAKTKQLAMSPYKQTAFQPGRFDGVKKTSERLDQQSLSMTITVVGSSRADLEAKLDALYAGLAQRQQALTIHQEDARYYIADALTGKAKLAPGNVLAVDVPITFVAQQPFAYAPVTSTQSFGPFTLTPVRGQTNVWQLPSAQMPLSIPAGGNIFCHPTFTLTNNTSANKTTLASGLTQGTTYTSLSVAALPNGASAGQVFILSNGTNVQRVTLSANALAGATSLSVASFVATANFSSGNLCALDIYLQSATLYQDPDGQVLTIPYTSVGPTLLDASTSLTIATDPSTSSGQLVTASPNPSTLLAFVGTFPTLEPTATQVLLNVTCSNTPTLTLSASWRARWLA